MSMYDIPVNYDGRTIILHSDPDRIVFLNHDKIVWLDGTPLTNEEVIEYLKYFGRHGLTPVNEKFVHRDIVFVDGNSEYLYGTAIKESERKTRRNVVIFTIGLILATLLLGFVALKLSGNGL